MIHNNYNKIYNDILIIIDNVTSYQNKISKIRTGRNI